MRLEVDGVLFDNDGVLVDSHAHVEQAWRQLVAEFDLDVSTLGSMQAGVRAVDTLSRYLSGQVLAEAVDRLEQLEVDLAHDLRALPGAVELCASLPSTSWTIVTSASRRLATARWAGAGIPVPVPTVTADQVTHGKPHPEPYLVAAELLGLDPGRCVVFEDSVSGAEAARTAGAVVVAVGAAPWPFEPIARIADLTAVTMADSSTHRLGLTIDVDRA